MFKNYFKIAWRSLVRNKISSFINIAGLAVGLATGIIMMLWITDEFSYDKFHADLPNISLMMKHSKQGNEINSSKSVPGPLGPVLRTEIPEIKYVARTTYPEQQLLNAVDKSVYEQCIYTEPDYFSIMTYPALSGDPKQALTDPASVVITERTAKKLFGNADVLGKTIRHNNIHELKVGAVIRDVPSNSSEQFDVVLPFSIFEKENSGWINNWDNNSIRTWVATKPSINRAALDRKLTALVQKHENNSSEMLSAYPLQKLWLHGKFSNGKPSGGRIDIMMLLGAIGLFVLLIACINFMNLATAQSERRAREVGVRKVLGAFRKQVILQFLCEAFLITFFAMLLGILLAKMIVPSLNQLGRKNLAFDFSSIKIWIALISIALFTGLIAGSYPAFFLSRFKPVRVLKGILTNSKGGSVLRRGLVTFQFIISIFLIITTIVIFNQLKYVQDRPVGYEQENLIDIPARGDMKNKFQLLKNELLQISAIKNVSAGSDNLVQFVGSTDGVEWPGKTADQNFPVTVTSVQYDWVKTTGLHLVAGRDFSTEFGNDSLSCLINETAAKAMSLKEPVIGTKLGTSTVIGVVQDFVYNDPAGSPRAMLVSLSTGSMNHFLVRVSNDDHWKTTIAKIEKVVKKTNPNYPFEFQFTTEVYQQKMTGIRSTGQLLSGIGVLAIFISCLGLFGLSAFVAERRGKEIGIRKVLGASASRIWFTLSKDFIKPVLLAFVLASPLAAFVMQKLLLSMDYHIALSWWMFVLSGVIAILIALITVSFQGIKAALINPVKSLRTE